ncbi:MAG: hypothetical protein WBP72_00030, partial [Rhodocyclaceae bacterium]
MAAAQGRPVDGVAAPRFAVNAASADSVNISSVDAQVEEGASLSAMGGFLLAAGNSLTAGNGGAIRFSLLAPLESGAPQEIGALRLDGRLQGFSLAKGATLNLAGRFFTLADAGGEPQIRDTDGARTMAVAPAFFRQGGFSGYTLSGIDGVRIAAGTEVAPRAEGIAVTVRGISRGSAPAEAGVPSALAAAGDTGVDAVLAGGDGEQTLAADLHLRDKPAGERQTTNLAVSSKEGSVVMEEGAVIRADPRAAVSFTSTGSRGNIDLLGRVVAPGGSIRATLTNGELLQSDAAGLFDPANPDVDRQSGAIHLGANAVLDVSGTFVAQSLAGSGRVTVIGADGTAALRQRVQGEVLTGGQVGLSATNARVVADAGSLVDVSAAAAAVDLPSGANTGVYETQTVWSDAGAISVSSTEASRLDGGLAGHAAGQGAGGSFSMDFHRRAASDNTDPNNPPRADFDHAVVVTQGVPGSGLLVSDSGPPLVTGRVSADALAAGGFDAVSLKSDHSVVLDGPVDIAAARSVTLDAPVIDVRDGSGTHAMGTQASVRASRVALMNTTGNPPVTTKIAPTTPVAAIPTTAGNGTFTARAQLIDLIGSVTVNGVATGRDTVTGEPVASVLLDSSGDIRATGLPVSSAGTATVDKLEGGLYSEGNLELRAQQVYPTTLSAYTIASRGVESGTLATRRSGTVRVVQNAGAAGDVLSAGGSLTLSGSDVEQRGTVKAPLGTITLEADRVTLATGSTTSVSLAGLTVPFGETELGRNWIYALAPYSGGEPLDTATLVETAPPAKQIVLSGQSVAVDAGARIDLSGGGDLQAFEFVAGPGGSKDVLQTASPAQTWAILPSMRLAAAPVDTHLASRNGVDFTSAGNPYYQTYNTLYVSGVAGLA